MAFLQQPILMAPVEAESSVGIGLLLVIGALVLVTFALRAGLNRLQRRRKLAAVAGCQSSPIARNTGSVSTCH